MVHSPHFVSLGCMSSHPSWPEKWFSHCHKRVLWTRLQDDSSSSKLSLSKANGGWDFKKKQTLKDFQCDLTFSTYFSPSPIAPGWLIPKEVITLASHWVKTALLQDLSTLSCSRWSGLCIPCPPDGPPFPWPSSRLELSLLTKKQELTVKSREERVAFPPLSSKKSARLFHSFVYLELQRETSMIKLKIIPDSTVVTWQRFHILLFLSWRGKS